MVSRPCPPSNKGASSLIPITVSLVRGLDGVVDVVDRLTFELDDTPIMVPSDLLMDRTSAVRRRT